MSGRAELLSLSILFALSSTGLSAQATSTEIVAPSGPVTEGDSIPLSTIVRDSAGHEITGEEMHWFSRDPRLAEITSQGVLLALNTGKVEVFAFAGTRTPGSSPGRLELEIKPLPIASVRIALPTQSLFAGASALAQVEGLNRLGKVRVGGSFSFRSSAPAVARVDEGGRVTAVAPGSAHIEARTGTARSSVAVKVVPNPVTALRLEPADTALRTGDVLHFRLSAQAGAHPLGPPYTEWSVAGVGASVYDDGAFVADQPGTYTVVAGVGSRTARATVMVTARQTRKQEFKLVGRGAIRDVHTADLLIFDEGGKTWSYVPSWGSDVLYIYETTDPANPILTDSVKVDARVINDVTITPDHKFAVMTREGASNRKNGIVILDTSDPGHPKPYSEYTQTVTGGVHNAWTEGYYVFLTDDATGSMRVIDIHDPKNAKEVARWQVNRETGRALHDVIVQDGLAYLSYGFDGLVVLDVGAGIRGGSPTNPQLVMQYKEFKDREFWTHTAWRYKNYVIVGDELFPPQPVGGFDAPEFPYGYFHIVDVSDWNHPKEVAKYEIPWGGSHNVWMNGDTLYVGYYQAGLRAVDLSGELRGDLVAQGREIAAFLPQDPKGRIANWPFTWGPQYHNGLVYASDFNSGLWIVKLEGAQLTP